MSHAMELSMVFSKSCQAPIATEPSEGALNNPSAREQFEALGGVGSLDDLQRPFTLSLKRVFEFLTCVAAVGEHMAEPGETGSDRDEQIGRAGAILDVGGMNDRGDQQTAGVGGGNRGVRRPLRSSHSDWRAPRRWAGPLVSRQFRDNSARFL